MNQCPTFMQIPFVLPTVFCVACDYVPCDVVVEELTSIATSTRLLIFSPTFLIIPFTNAKDNIYSPMRIKDVKSCEQGCAPMLELIKAKGAYALRC